MKYVITNTNGDKFINEESYPNDDCVFDELSTYGHMTYKLNDLYYFSAKDHWTYKEFVKLKVGNQ